MIIIDKTTRNLAIGLIVGGLTIGGLAWIASPAPGTNGAKNPKTPTVLTADPQDFDFGSISMAAGTVTRTVTITNPSPEPVTISRLTTSCMCTVATLKTNDGESYGPFGMPGHGIVPTIDVTVAAGASATVDIAFDPAAHGPAGVGRIARTVFLENSAGKPLSIDFTAMVTP